MVSIDLPRFVNRPGTWLEAAGPDADVVISCRTRLARNVEGYRFVSRMDTETAQELCGRLSTLLSRHSIDGETILVTMTEASPLLRLVLQERHLVSRDLAPGDPRRAARPGRAVAFGEHETLSVMINEEDHLRLQAISPGLALEEAWGRVRDLDRALEADVGFCFDEDLGYLTGCPTNVGTGMRASIMLHLPALGLVRTEIEKVFHAAQRTGLAVRGMYGEGSRAAGDFYQISNQVTLGCTEEELLADLHALVPAIVEFERRVRKVLLEEQRAAVLDRVRRSYGLLRTARSMQTDVALMHLSNVRLGACVGLFDFPLDPVALNRIAVQIQKGHVQILAAEGEAPLPDALAEPTERDRLRAAFLRKRFAEFERG